MNKIIPFLLAALLAPAVASAQADWKPVGGKLMTRWAKDVSPTNVHPEYPRPQMVRAKWQNLNGLWDYAIKPKDAQPPTAYDGKILVPFPVESALSGVGKSVGEGNKLWYRRSFAVPADWRTGGQRVLLNFGAVDWESVVYVNERKVGDHRGGYDPFSFDITDALTSDGEQRIVVEVRDPSSDGYQPRGKQVRDPKGIWYTPSTGIWQTVWMEPVPKATITALDIVPDTDKGIVRVTPTIRGATAGHKLSLFIVDPDRAKENRKPSGTGQEAGGAVRQRVGTTIELPVADAKRWSPDRPFLYGLKVGLFDGEELIDEVESYCAFRKLSVAKDDKGIPRLMLNDKFVFQYGTLDQGFWPDGLYTAPTDAAMRYDLEVTKRLGFNMIRKHVKVEPATWYHHCDKLGLLVWQDMPSGDAHIRRNGDDLVRSKESAENYERELKAIIASLRNFPSIVMWVPFNEGWGQYDTARIAELTKKLDPSRWVNSTSGWVDRGVGNVLDLHIYPGPNPSKDAIKPRGTRALVLGEFGGLGLPLKGHTWKDEKNWGYRSFDNSEALTDAYVTLLAKLHPLIADPGYSAAIYTQTTDVEIEVNGLMTYDRDLIKMDEGRMVAAAKRLFGPPPVIATVVPDARTAEIDWKFTFDKPADAWQATAFDDSAWKTGKAGFGTAMTPGTTVRTEWKGKEIWVRRTFDLPADTAIGSLHLMMHHDEDADVYLNGVLATRVTGFTTEYSLLPIRPEAIKALKPGQNVIAIQCRQTSGGQYIDAGLVSVR
ncbi:glycoside hydrolase family 2 protein [Humisphaera borealis]|uniref:Beta-galactosidase n=1 Tax=Humisphaera borealis TaxID=2807512 RepID=A0A7M2X4I3_9BACT|nr:sugar-binding domain-containing protein [Humisphaera borealis]QOV91961.1 hypothetical protein IPV69_11645 [Humisphaera borealis]